MNNKRILTESRVGDAYMKIYDGSDSEKFKLIIESNVLKKFKFSVKAFGMKISVAGEYEEKFGNTKNVQRMAYDYILPIDVDPYEVTATETKKYLKIEAPIMKK